MQSQEPKGMNMTRYFVATSFSDMVRVGEWIHVTSNTWKVRDSLTHGDAAGLVIKLGAKSEVKVQSANRLWIRPSE